MPQVVDDGGSIPPTRSNPWVVGSNPSLAAKKFFEKNWRSGRVVYSRSLENFRSSNGAVGSNPASSAEYTNFKKICYIY